VEGVEAAGAGDEPLPASEDVDFVEEADVLEESADAGVSEDDEVERLSLR
jgi:hypothetical protein